MRRIRAAIAMAAWACVGLANAQDVTLSGIVVGNGADKARIVVHHNLGIRGRVEPVRSGTTAADGTFRLQNVPWLREQGWTAGSAILIARTRNRVGMIQIHKDDHARSHRIELRRTRSLRGTIRSETTGQPIAKAVVWPMIFIGPHAKANDLLQPPKVWPTAPLAPWRAVSDDDGRFELSSVPECDQYLLVAYGPKHGQRQILVHDDHKQIDIELDWAGRIAGRVWGSDGKPLSGAVVWVDGRKHCAFVRTITDDHGKFLCDSLPADRYRVMTVRHEGVTAAVDNIAVKSGEATHGVELRHPLTGTLIGSIVDDATGKPINGLTRASVTARVSQAPDNDAKGGGYIQLDGTFRIEAPVGENRISVWAPGWEPAAATATVTTGKQTPLVVRLRKSTNGTRKRR